MDKRKNKEKIKTTIKRNKSIVGRTIEEMMESLLEGEGIEGIEDRDLVYNDGEAKAVNPITNIRSDKMELMLEEKIGEQQYKHQKSQRVADEGDREPQNNEGDSAED